MEVVEEPPLHNPSMDSLKIGVVQDTSAGIAVASEETNVCHKSNGVSDPSESGEAATLKAITVTTPDKPLSKADIEKSVSELKSTPSASDSVLTAQTESAVVEDTTSTIEKSVEASDEVTKSICESKDTNETNATNETKMEDIVIEATVDQVTFETEILVESNDGEVIESINEDAKNELDNTNNILSELGESIELSEALRSSDVTDNVENNNCGARQEVFNKEELLDILEGNDDQTDNVVAVGLPPLRGDKILESQKALEQLSRLKIQTKKHRNFERIPRKKRQKNFLVEKNIARKVKDENDRVEGKNVDKDGGGNIVKDLVKDWDDEDGAELDKSKNLVEDNDTLSQSSSDTVAAQGSIIKEDDASIRTSVDSQSADGKTNRSGDESQPQRRLGRVIKKKVIFDPDNPDTFTKSKQVKSKDNVQDKDQTPIKKIKPEPDLQRPKSKSPISKLQWKKPSPKNIKQNKRLSEVDRLLMDEGAVNMIYQLTPEAPKGKGKNMKSKAEIIKKIQSSETPDTKEMKFRERKKESKYEESEARKILGGKHRPSLSSSVKSPCVSEEFEAHSADDSIIYRRHSSSSYSSSCMSPRRLSDVEVTSQAPRTPQASSNHEAKSDNTTIEVFLPDGAELLRPEIINKDDCMSIKEKLNSKLNLALKKRKRENSKTDKSLKQKKVKYEENNINNDDFKYLSVTFDEKVAVICIQKSISISTIEIIKELEKAFKIIDLNKDITVTLLLPECGTAYSELDLKSLLDDNKEKRTTHAFKLAESIRSLLHTMGHHSKLLCSGASGRCSGVALAIIGISDVALASERASFGITAKTQSMGPVEPGTSVLTSYCNLRESVLMDLVVLGRRMSASDALQSGLVSRVLWPEKFNEQVLTVAKEIAAQPAQNIWLKKQMLNLKRSGSETTFLNCLEKERDMFVEYWTSVEGQELLRASYSSV